MNVNKLRHKVQINVSDREGNRERVMTSSRRKLPARLLRLLFGEMADVMVITPGKSVEGIEIKEIGGAEDDQSI